MTYRAGFCILMFTIVGMAPRVHAGADMLHPASGQRMLFPVSGKTHQYFRLEAGSTTTVKVDGAGELKFIVRAVTDNATATPISYSVVVSEGNQPLKTIQTETVASPTMWTGTHEFAAKSRSFKLQIPNGSHVLTVAFQSESARAAGFRYAFKKGAASEPQVAIQATGARESVTLLVKERPLDYYVTDAVSPVQVNVVGPTSLRVVSRLIFPAAARGKLNYALKIQRDGKSLPDAALTTTKSDVTECAAHRDWILGKSMTSDVDVPKGAHVVTVRLSNADAPGVALKFSIPKEAIGGH